MECLVKYLEAINHLNNTNMFSQEFTDNIELQGSLVLGHYLIQKVPEVCCLKVSSFPICKSHSQPSPINNEYRNTACVRGRGFTSCVSSVVLPRKIIKITKISNFLRPTT